MSVYKCCDLLWLETLSGVSDMAYSVHRLSVYSWRRCRPLQLANDDTIIMWPSARSIADTWNSKKILCMCEQLALLCCPCFLPGSFCRQCTYLNCAGEPGDETIQHLDLPWPVGTVTSTSLILSIIWMALLFAALRESCPNCGRLLYTVSWTSPSFMYKSSIHSSNSASILVLHTKCKYILGTEMIVSLSFFHHCHPFITVHFLEIICIILLWQGSSRELEQMRDTLQERSSELKIALETVDSLTSTNASLEEENAGLNKKIKVSLVCIYT